MSDDRSPKHLRKAFHCPAPTCGVYTEQLWSSTWRRDSQGQSMYSLGEYNSAKCVRCSAVSFWRGEQMIYPLARQGEPPHPDMPDDVLKIYEEARDVAPVSRKSAAGLLRLGLQTLIDDLEPGSGGIDTKIGRLVTRGLDEQVQKAMDILRVVGNESVHPGEIDLAADDEMLPALFNVTNLIVEQVIARPKRVGDLYSKLPPGKLDAIARRDGTAAHQAEA